MRKLVLLFVLGALLLVATSAYADKRSYVWTYEYQTMPKGWLEVEFYLTGEQPDLYKARRHEVL